jgi:hypothetical protein
MTLSVTSIGDNPQIPGSAAETYIPDQLIAGDFKLVTDNVILASGVIYTRGAIIGVTTSTGLGTISKATATDGSQNPIGVLATFTDLTATGPQGVINGNAGIYLTGEFNQNVIGPLLDPSWTLTTIKPVLRALSIFLKAAVSASDPT